MYEPVQKHKVTPGIPEWLDKTVLEVRPFKPYPDNKVHGANMGPTWVLLAPDGPHVGPMNLAIRDKTCWNLPEMLQGWHQTQRKQNVHSLFQYNCKEFITVKILKVQQNAQDYPSLKQLLCSINLGICPPLLMIHLWTWLVPVSIEIYHPPELLVVTIDSSSFWSFPISPYWWWNQNIPEQPVWYQSCYPDSKVHGANMGPIWGWQDPGGPHVGPMNFG